MGQDCTSQDLPVINIQPLLSFMCYFLTFSYFLLLLWICFGIVSTFTDILGDIAFSLIFCNTLRLIGCQVCFYFLTNFDHDCIYQDFIFTYLGPSFNKISAPIAPIIIFFAFSYLFKKIWPQRHVTKSFSSYFRVFFSTISAPILLKKFIHISTPSMFFEL